MINKFQAAIIVIYTRAGGKYNYKCRQLTKESQQNRKQRVV